MVSLVTCIGEAPTSKLGRITWGFSRFSFPYSPRCMPESYDNIGDEVSFRIVYCRFIIDALSWVTISVVQYTLNTWIMESALSAIFMQPKVFIFFFLSLRYRPSWTLAPSVAALSWSRTCDFHLRFLTPIVFRYFPLNTST
jgi:hypothetical protein